MAAIHGGIPVTGFMSPTDELDEFPVTITDYQKGGWRVVETIAERDAIPLLRRQENMQVLVNENQTMYGLNSDISSWRIIGQGANSVRYFDFYNTTIISVPNVTAKPLIELYVQSSIAEPSLLGTWMLGSTRMWQSERPDFYKTQAVEWHYYSDTGLLQVTLPSPATGTVALVY